MIKMTKELVNAVDEFMVVMMEFPNEDDGWKLYEMLDYDYEAFKNLVWDFLSEWSMFDEMDRVFAELEKTNGDIEQMQTNIKVAIREEVARWE